MSTPLKRCVPNQFEKLNNGIYLVNSRRKTSKNKLAYHELVTFFYYHFLFFSWTWCNAIIELFCEEYRFPIMAFIVVADYSRCYYITDGILGLTLILMIWKLLEKQSNKDIFRWNSATCNWSDIYSTLCIFLIGIITTGIMLGIHYSRYISISLFSRRIRYLLLICISSWSHLHCFYFSSLISSILW